MSCFSVQSEVLFSTLIFEKQGLKSRYVTITMPQNMIRLQRKDEYFQVASLVVFYTSGSVFCSLSVHVFCTYVRLITRAGEMKV